MSLSKCEGVPAALFIKLPASAELVFGKKLE
jgi:hypothetical protein